jgi:hypothetical protein
MAAPLSPLSPLVKLRVSLARVAQLLDLGSRIPGYCGTTANFEQLTTAAMAEERGWNALAAAIADAVERQRNEA